MYFNHMVLKRMNAHRSHTPKFPTFMISSILCVWDERTYSYTLVSDPQYSFGIGDYEKIDISSPGSLEEEFLHLIFIGQRQKETLATPEHV